MVFASTEKEGCLWIVCKSLSEYNTFILRKLPLFSVVEMAHTMSGEQKYCYFDSVPGEALEAAMRKQRHIVTKARGRKGRKRREGVRNFVFRKKCP